MIRKLTPVLLIAVFVIVGLSQRTYAYIDPGSGSYALQLCLAGLFGMILSAKSLWEKVRAAMKSSNHDRRR